MYRQPVDVIGFWLVVYVAGDLEVVFFQIAAQGLTLTARSPNENRVAALEETPDVDFFDVLVDGFHLPRLVGLGGAALNDPVPVKDLGDGSDPVTVPVHFVKEFVVLGDGEPVVTVMFEDVGADHDAALGDALVGPQGFADLFRAHGLVVTRLGQLFFDFEPVAFGDVRVVGEEFDVTADQSPLGMVFQGFHLFLEAVGRAEIVAVHPRGVGRGDRG